MTHYSKPDIVYSFIKCAICMYEVYTICKVQSTNSSYTPNRLEVQHFCEHRKLLLVNTIFAKHASTEITFTSTLRMTARTGKG